jgi:hypothetical protein
MAPMTSVGAVRSAHASGVARSSTLNRMSWAAPLLMIPSKIIFYSTDVANYTLLMLPVRSKQACTQINLSLTKDSELTLQVTILLGEDNVGIFGR